MPRLFSYTIPIDDGSAPNPFRGMCSLAICKPGIRRTAEEGDWVAGLGSKKAPSGGQLYGWPDFIVKWRSVGACETCKARQKDGECDDPC